MRWGELVVKRHNWRYYSHTCDGIYIDVQADWRRSSWTYGRAPNAIDISKGSLTRPSKHRHGTTLFIRWFRHTAPISRLLRHAWDTEEHSRLNRRALTVEKQNCIHTIICFYTHITNCTIFFPVSNIVVH